MHLRDFLRAQKSITSILGWQHTKMPKTKFPLSKNRSFKVGVGWVWTLLEIEADGKKFRLLVAYHPGKENYFAHLGLEAGADMHLIGSLEYHSNHAGWHAHGCCEPLEKSHVGRMRYPTMKRLPSGDKYHRNIEFGVSASSALKPALDFFKLHGALSSAGGKP